jgi:ribosomal protein S11
MITQEQFNRRDAAEFEATAKEVTERATELLAKIGNVQAEVLRMTADLDNPDHGREAAIEDLEDALLQVDEIRDDQHALIAAALSFTEGVAATIPSHDGRCRGMAE